MMKSSAGAYPRASLSLCLGKANGGDMETPRHQLGSLFPSPCWTPDQPSDSTYRQPSARGKETQAAKYLSGALDL